MRREVLFKEYISSLLFASSMLTLHEFSVTMFRE